MESIMLNEWILPEINIEKCTGCGDCVTSCAQNSLAMGSTVPHFAHPETCTYCADCENVCPNKAIRCAYEIIWED